MDINRRQSIGLALAATTAMSVPSHAAARGGIRAVAFDAFPIFDPRSVLQLASGTLSSYGDGIAKLWFERIFSYMWLRSTAERYVTFDIVAKEALLRVTRERGAPLDDHVAETLVQAFGSMAIWPDVRSTLDGLRAGGLRLAILSNVSEGLLHRALQHNGIESSFDYVLSTDRVQAFKPAPKAYQLARDVFGLEKQQIAFAAFASWDAVGARWFGYPTAWINRAGAPAEELEVQPDSTGSDLRALTSMVLA